MMLSVVQLTPQQKLQQQILNNQHQVLLQQKHLQQQQQQQQLKQYHQVPQQNHSNNGSPWMTPNKRNGLSVYSGVTNNGVAYNGVGQNSVTVTSSSESNDSLVFESRTTKPLFNDDLLVIERSNRELELKLTPTKQQLNEQQQLQQHLLQQQQQQQKHVNTTKQPTDEANLNHQKHVQSNQAQKEVKPDSPSTGKVVKNLRFSLPASQKKRSVVVVDTIHNNNGAGYADVIYEEFSTHCDEVERIKNKISARPLSECYSASQDNLDAKSTPQSFPSIGDLTSPAMTFKSLTAQKLMSGLSFNSIDTLLEVNAAAEARSKHNESTETIDFGVI